MMRVSCNIINLLIFIWLNLCWKLQKNLDWSLKFLNCKFKKKWHFFFRTFWKTKLQSFILGSIGSIYSPRWFEEYVRCTWIRRYEWFYFHECDGSLYLFRRRMGSHGTIRRHCCFILENQSTLYRLIISIVLVYWNSAKNCSILKISTVVNIRQLVHSWESSICPKSFI